MTDDLTTDAETKRGRVRRLLIQPLTERGMRFATKGRHAVDPEAQARFLDRLCDDLAYLRDDELARLARWAEANGEGPRKDLWPPAVSFLGLAQVIRPRPLEDIRELASWFGSARGAELIGTPARLVAEFRFVEAKRRPPVHPAEQTDLAARARALAADVDRWRELRKDNRTFDDAGLDAFDRDLARVLPLVEAGIAKRAGQGAAA